LLEQHGLAAMASGWTLAGVRQSGRHQDELPLTMAVVEIWKNLGNELDADVHPSQSNALEFCLGSLSEMTEGDIYQVTEKHAKVSDIAYVHFRNVTGRMPNYQETFVDDGDMVRVISILDDAGYDGVIIPDHTPLMTSDAPWRAGMAYAMGYMRALQSMS
jgi:D-mannonate dehydratase